MSRLQELMTKINNTESVEEKSNLIADIAAEIHTEYNVSNEEIRELFIPLFNPFLECALYDISTEDKYNYLQKIVDDYTLENIDYNIEVDEELA